MRASPGRHNIAQRVSDAAAAAAAAAAATAAAAGAAAAWPHLSSILTQYSFVNDRKSTRLALYTLEEEFIEPLSDVGLYGRVASLAVFRPRTSQTDWLFVGTERNEFCILAFDETSNKIVTKARGDFYSPLFNEAGCGQLAIVEPKLRCIVMHMYDGFLKVIPIENESGDLGVAFDLNLDESGTVLDVQFMHGTAKPTIALLYRDAKEYRHLKAYEIDIADQSFRPAALSKSQLDPATRFVRCLPGANGGILLFGEKSIHFYSQRGEVRGATIMTNPAALTTVSPIDESKGDKWLMSDHMGNISILALEFNAERRAADMQLQRLGTTSAATCLCYLAESVIFVGSAFGDSKLIKMQSEVTESGDFFIELDSFMNTGPIVDMCLMDLDRQGQSQVVTCSGAYSDGSLRVIRSGIGVEETATIEMPGIKGVWSVRPSAAAEFDKYVVIAFLAETRVLAMEDGDEGELGELDIEGLNAETQTLLAINVLSQHMLQATRSELRLIDLQSFACVATWSPPDKQEISVIDANRAQVVLACGGKEVFYVEIDEQSLSFKQSGQRTLQNEVSCLDISPLGDSERADFCTVGLWRDMSVRLLALNKSNLDEASQAQLGGSIQSRSIRAVTLGDTSYVFVGLGDGHLYCYSLDRGTGALNLNKKMLLGTKPIELSVFQSDGVKSVFAACDRPTVVHCAEPHNKLTYSHVNLKDVTHICSFHSQPFPNSLCIVNEEELMVGAMDGIQKLHINSVPLGEMPRRVVHLPAWNIVAVVTAQQLADRAAYGESLPAPKRAKTSEASENAAAAAAAAPMDTDEGAAPAASAAAAAAAAGAADDDDNNNNDDSMSERFFLRFFDDQTFEETGFLALNKHEHGTLLRGVCSANASFVDIGGGGASAGAVAAAHDLLLLGTGFIVGEESLSRSGRLLLIGCGDSREPTLVSERAIEGCAYDADCFVGTNRVAVTVGSRLHVFGVESGAANGDNYKLEELCSASGHNLSLYVRVRGEFVIVGDMLKSLSAYRLHSSAAKARAEDAAAAAAAPAAVEKFAFRLIALDYYPRWLSAIETLSDDVYCAAEDDDNLIVLRRNDDATTDEERARLDTVGVFHLGDYVNIFRTGSLVMKPSAQEEDDVPNVHTVLFGTVSGALGVMASLEQKDFEFFSKVEYGMRQVVHGVGGLSHESWRSMRTNRVQSPPSRFIDGDLVELFAELGAADAERVAKAADLDVATIVRRLDALTRILH